MIEEARLVKAFRDCQTELIGVIRAYGPRHPASREASAAMEDLNAVALLVTGKPGLLQGPQHSTPGPLKR